MNSIPGIVERRAALMQLLAAMEVPPNLNVNSEDRMVPGPEGAPDVRVRVYRPAAASGPLPGIYCIHGGGMILGDIEGEGAAASAICDQVGAVGVSVDYRLAPEHPHPAPVEDCYAGLTWMARNAAEHEISDIWPFREREARQHRSWPGTWYLGDGQPDEYAAPARAEDLSGLPPAFIDVGTVDLFRDEDIAFAMRLMAAGVPVELHVSPGAYHASENFAAEAPLSRRIWERRIAALRRALSF